MICPRALRPKWMGFLAIVAGTAILGAGCMRPRPPVAKTTTTAAVTAASTTTTVAGHGHDHAGDDGNDKGWSLLMSGHDHHDPDVPLDDATQAQLDRQLDLTRQLAAKYPTVAAAEAAGYRQGGPFTPGMGAH